MAFGLTPDGFIAKQESEIQAEIQSSLSTAFGESINLLPESVFGQIVGIFAEREALIWQLAEAVYASQYPAGAEGTSVDNILALNALKRLPASPSKTAPVTNGIPGLKVLGTPLTVVTKGSLISVFGQTQYQFTIDEDILIENPINAIQTLYFTEIPDAGSFKIKIGLLETADIDWDDAAADIQTKIRALTGYDDVTVTGTYGTGFVITFAGDSGEQEQPEITIEDNTLFKSATAVNVNVVYTQDGAPAQGLGSATCTQNGPIPAPANTLTVIDSPISGWDSVTNPLDVIPGAFEENDTEAIERRNNLLASQGNGPIQSIVQKVLLIEGVQSAIGFENLSEAALQLITFESIPTAGTYQLFINGVATSALAYNATAAQIQTAIRNLPSFNTVLVSGDYQFGFTVDFNGSNGGQPQPLILALNNTLVDGISPVAIDIEFDRPPKSFEIVVVGGDDPAIAQAIYNSKPAGIQSYGNVSEVISDDFGNPYTISFSRPDSPPVYVTIAMLVEQGVFPGDGVTQVQDRIVEIGDAIQIGGLIIGYGTNGLIGAFNDIEGILDYDLTFGLSPNPISQDNIQLLATQRAFFETFNVIVTITYQ